MKTISVAEQFSRFPAGRFRSDGPRSGQAFREDVLEPALREGPVRVLLGGTLGFGSSFLEEAFGGLIREARFTPAYVEEHLTVEAPHDPSLEIEIRQYLRTK